MNPLPNLPRTPAPNRRTGCLRVRPILTMLFLAGTMAAAAAQSTPAAQPASAPLATAPAGAAAQSEPTAAPAPAPAQTQIAAMHQPKIITVPTGTRVLLQLRSAINTKSAKPGDGVYLNSAFPVVVGNRVVIPSGVYVQGVVDSVVRPGRRSKAQLNMHFTSMIFPNGSVVEIPGMVNSLPGAKQQSVQGDEGTIQQDGGSNRGHNAGETAKIAVPTGATVGSIAGLGAGHPLAGGLEGVGAGLAAAGIVALFTKNAEVNIDSGTQVEMVLQRPLLLEESNLDGPATLVPATAQPQPMMKPGLHDRSQILCPPGSLGCS